MNLLHHLEGHANLGNGHRGHVNPTYKTSFPRIVIGTLIYKLISGKKKRNELLINELSSNNQKNNLVQYHLHRIKGELIQFEMNQRARLVSMNMG
jgi:hypothetical protein